MMISESKRNEFERILVQFGDKTPWAHNPQKISGRIDACLCVKGGMTLEEIAQTSECKTARVTNHINTDLKVGKWCNGKPAPVESEITPEGEIKYSIKYW